tara:strand:- start:1628 stop:1771 length:144 start_codon:yes stop_codon:yes gene_type:complete
MVLIIPEDTIAEAEVYLKAVGEKTYRIGDVTEGDRLVEYKNDLFVDN